MWTALLRPSPPVPAAAPQQSLSLIHIYLHVADVVEHGVQAQRVAQVYADGFVHSLGAGVVRRHQGLHFLELFSRRRARQLDARARGQLDDAEMCIRDSTARGFLPVLQIVCVLHGPFRFVQRLARIAAAGVRDVYKRQGKNFALGEGLKVLSPLHAHCFVDAARI